MGFGKDGKGEIIYDSTSQNMGALASLDLALLGGRYDDNLLEDFRIVKIDYWMSMRPAQAIVVLDGPLLVGIADSSLTAAEIEEAIESQVLNSNSTSSEESMRAVWPLEVFNLSDPDGGPQSDLTRKDSKNLKWTFNNPNGWQWWVYNMSPFAITTGSQLIINAKAFGVWVN